MKKKIILILFSLIFTSSFSQDWKMVTKDNEGTTYAKQKRKNKIGNIEINFKTNSKQIKYYDENGNVAIVYNGYSKDLREYNCQERKSRFLYMIIYDSSGNVLKNVDHSSKWNYIVPDTYGETLSDYACGK